MHQPHPTNQKQQDNCVLTEKRPTWSTLRLCKQCRCTWLRLNYRLPKALWANIYYSQVEREALAKVATLFLNQGLLNYHHVTIDYSISKKSTQWAKQTNDNMTCNFELSPMTSAQSNKKTIYTNSMKYHSHVHPVLPYAARMQQDTRNLPLSSLFTTTSVVSLWAPGSYPRPFEVPKIKKKQLPTPRLLTGTKRVGYSNAEQTKLEERSALTVTTCWCVQGYRATHLPLTCPVGGKRTSVNHEPCTMNCKESYFPNTLVITPPWWSNIHNQSTIVVAMSSLQISNISTMSMDMTNPEQKLFLPKNGAMVPTVIFVYQTGRYFQDVQWLLPKDWSGSNR